MANMQTIKQDNAPVSLWTTWTDRLLKGVGQIMLQENSWTGLLFLLGIAYGSPLMGIAAVLAILTGTITGLLLKSDKEGVEQGLYGFSPALVGVALLLFFKPEPFTWGLVIVGAVLAAYLQHIFMQRHIPVFTFPFILVTWIMLYIVKHYFPALLAEPGLTIEPSEYAGFEFALKGYGQVIFQGSLVSGLLFFIAVFISSPVAALYGLAAAVIAGVLAQYAAISAQNIADGLFSFNAVLCAITFAGIQKKDGYWVFLSVLLSIAISVFFYHYELPQLTFPFVAASFLVVILKRKFSH